MLKTVRADVTAHERLPTFFDPQTMTVSGQTNAAPETALETSPTGRYGVALARVSFAEGVGLEGTSADHLIGIILSRPVHTSHVMAGKRLDHESGPGSLCICPSGADYTAEFDGPIDGILLQVSTECLALASAQLDGCDNTLVDRMDGRDDVLCRMGRTLEAEAAAGHPNGLLFWGSLTDALLRRLAVHHHSTPAGPPHSVLDALSLRRLDAFIQDNLAAPLDLVTLAAVVGCDRFHFAHRFRAATGVSPHRYVVRRRLERARALLVGGYCSAAEVAAATGFSDQSHLTNWMRRVYRVTPGRITDGRKGARIFKMAAPAGG